MLLVASTLAGLAITYYLLICIHRLTLHPLAKYPGPWQRAVSFWPQALSHIRGNAHVDIQQLHEKYGDVVRVAPDSLAFRSSKAVHEIYNRKANVIKTGWTDVSLAINPTISTHSLSDRPLHAKTQTSPRQRFLGFRDPKSRTLRDRSRQCFLSSHGHFPKI